MPKISVIMSVYSEPIEWVHQSIDSILNQTFKDFEFIIVNDKPERVENAQLLTEYASQDKRIVIITNDTNIGLTKSLNKGLDIAKGEYIARMDADDISVANRFEKQLHYLESHPDIGVCGCAIEYFGAISGVHYFPQNITCSNLCIETVFAHPTIMCKAEIIQNFKYNPDFKVSQDYELWVRMCTSGVKMNNSVDVLLRYRISQAQISRKRNGLQFILSKKIRRKALCYIFKEDGNEIKEDFEIGQDILNLTKRATSFSIEQKKLLIYYLILSANSFKSMFELLFTEGNYYYVGFTNSLKLLYHKLFHHEMAKF